MRGLLNPLLVRPSARLPVRPVRAPSALIRPSARPLVRLHSPCRPPVRPSPVRPSASPLPHVRLSARPPPIRPPSAHPLVRLSPPVRPPSAPSALSKNYLPVSYGPQFFTSSTPREIATSAIRGASRSHSGIRVSKLPPLPSQP